MVKSKSSTSSYIQVSGVADQVARETHMPAISTKTGDAGESGLADGQRLGKDKLVFEVLGTIDEANAWLGMCLAAVDALPKDFQKKTMVHWNQLREIQDSLFHIGAEVAASPKTSLAVERLSRLEALSTKTQAHLAAKWMTKFFYPGGHELAARLDVTRTVFRRVERLLVRHHRDRSLSPTILKFTNRCSDYLYVLRVLVNAELAVTEHVFQVSPSKKVV